MPIRINRALRTLIWLSNLGCSTLSIFSLWAHIFVRFFRLVRFFLRIFQEWVLFFLRIFQRMGPFFLEIFREWVRFFWEFSENGFNFFWEFFRVWVRFFWEFSENGFGFCFENLSENGLNFFWEFLREWVRFFPRIFPRMDMAVWVFRERAGFAENGFNFPILRLVFFLSIFQRMSMGFPRTALGFPILFWRMGLVSSKNVPRMV